MNLSKTSTFLNIKQPQQRLLPNVLACLIGFLFQITCAYALESDKDESTRIDADQMTYSEQKQMNIFSGNVLLTRGSLVIRGDKLTFTQAENGKQLAVVQGKPATFRQQRDSEENTKLMIKGQANRIEYNSKKNQITLSGEANIIKTKNEQITEQISGEQITYEQTSEFLTVEGSASNGSTKSSRVKAVIKPLPPNKATQINE